MPGKRTLLLFARSPEAEARSKGLPPEPGAALFQAILESWLGAAGRVGAEVFLSSPPAGLARLESRFAGRIARCLPQSEAGFGGRLSGAARAAFALGAGTLIVAGGDCPAPATADLEAAFGELERGGTVLAPARDGGVTLVGIASARDVSLLTAVGLRRRDVFETLRAGLASGRRAPLVLPRVSDVDGPGDLRRLFSAAGEEEAWAPFQRLAKLALRTDRPSGPDRPPVRAVHAVTRRRPRGPPSRTPD